ncbi:hypothetical protein A3A39_00940 [Candidatus Kaiserbacteria bacterium RIFCSPLOWO2_01_FULL_54_13]|uniref:Uncharacterized protein n=1 Tax=Candidatus Kaiserbacteria bacterium RIFCSPLOWO2_01_FULL_54_13 TaxID=1798512 RepID=A0A1F6F1T3_9BACT|nr:MAG: hypothetical protein A3A39_00940 [Candidatus Kaiserbacteria bacterium RIFCSPLOWO2_01_FULL_54_13]
MTTKRIGVLFLYFIGFLFAFKVFAAVLSVIVIPIFYFMYAFFVGTTDGGEIVRSGLAYKTTLLAIQLVSIFLAFYLMKRIDSHYSAQTPKLTTPSA